MAKTSPGYELAVQSLTDLGIDVIFGMPGSETVELYEALRRSGIRVITNSCERGAAFAANGFYRSSGRPAAICTIGGPGFTNALTGLAEARDDSVALLHILVSRDQRMQRYGLQALDHERIATPIAKAYTVVDDAVEIAHALASAHETAISGEPGPVVVELTASSLATRAPPGSRRPDTRRALVDQGEVDEVAALLGEAQRPLIFVGQGAIDGQESVRDLAERLGCPVMATGSGRGIVPDDHPLSFVHSYGRGGVTDAVRSLVAESDLILALGCKLTHNGSLGFDLPLPPVKLVHIDASPEVLGANYPTRLSIVADVPEFLRYLVPRVVVNAAAEEKWPSLTPARTRFHEAKQELVRPDRFLTAPNGDAPATIFAALRLALPGDACVVADSGHHQFLVRSHYEVRTPRSLLFPADFQAMGYGLPAAIGAQLATPDRQVVAVIGDGGFAMTAMELATAVREAIPVKALVVANQALELIRRSQISTTGHEYGAHVINPDYRDFARSFGVAFARWEGLSPGDLQEFLLADQVGLLELRLADSRGRFRRSWRNRLRAATRKIGTSRKRFLRPGSR